MQLRNLQKLTLFVAVIWLINMTIDSQNSNGLAAQEIERYGHKYGHWLEKKLPRINLSDVNGRRVDVPDYGKNGKITIFKFWSAWTLACQHELESTAALKKDWGGQLDVDIEIVSVSLYDPKNAEKIKEYMGKNNMDFDVLVDPDDLFLKVFKAKGDVLPYTIVVDHKGNVIFEGKSEGNFLDDGAITNIIADARSRLPKVTPAEQRMNEKTRQQHRSLQIVSNTTPPPTHYQNLPQVTGYQPPIHSSVPKTKLIVPIVKDIPIVTLEEQRNEPKALKIEGIVLLEKPKTTPIAKTSTTTITNKTTVTTVVEESKPVFVEKPKATPPIEEIVARKMVKPELKIVPKPNMVLPKPESRPSQRRFNNTPKTTSITNNFKTTTTVTTIVEKPKVVTKPKPVIVEKPKVVTKPKPVIVEKPKTVAKPKPVIVEKPKAATKPKPVIVEKPKTVAKPKPVIVEKPKTVAKPKPVIVEKPKVVTKPKPVIVEKPKVAPKLVARPNPVMQKTTTKPTFKPTPKPKTILDSPPLVIFDKTKEPEKIADRSIQSTKNMKIKTLTPTLKIWDTQYVDGDTISLILNGKWILKNHLLTAKEVKVKVNLNKEGNNFLILYAHNEGLRPPNTAAVAIFDGQKERTFELSSNMKNCDAVNLKFYSGSEKK